MVLDDLQAVQNVDWPWAPAVKAILGPSSSLNYVGCVVPPGRATRRRTGTSTAFIVSKNTTLERTGSSCFVLSRI